MSTWPAMAATVLMLLCFVKMPAQVFYSNNRKYLKVKTEQNNLVSAYHFTSPDTTVTQLNNFFPRNFLGNTGLPSPAYFLNYGTDDLGFRFFNAPTADDRFLEKQVEYYRSKGPYANLTGIAGSKLYQVFKMSFTHTYKEKVNFTMKFNRYSSQGFYLRQQSYVNNFYLSSNYTTKSKRFGYYAFVLSNGNKNQENGGIRDGVLTDSTVALSKVLMPVRITSATRDNRETKIMFNPWLRLNKNSDSLGGGLNHYLQLKSRVALYAYKYRDNNMANDRFYRLIYLDTLLTNDSANVRQLSNELSYQLMSGDQKFAFSAGYKNEITSAWQQAASLYYNHILNSDLVLRRLIPAGDSLKERDLECAFNAQYVIAGYNAGNFKLENNTFFVLNAAKNRVAFFNALYEQRSPDYIYNNWISNNFFWQNNGYQPQRQLQARLGLRSGRYTSASVFYNAITNYLYFDNYAIPRQSAPLVSNLGVSAEYMRVFFKHLGILLNYTFQNTSNTALVRLPQNSGTAKLFYSGNLFHNNLQLQFGGQVQVYQGFTPYAYMPATQVFYLQNGFKTETYPYLDVFLNARIRPVSFFLKFENALSNGVAGLNYAFVPGYYQPERAFRFGLSWMFFD